MNLNITINISMNEKQYFRSCYGCAIKTTDIKLSDRMLNHLLFLFNQTKDHESTIPT